MIINISGKNINVTPAIREKILKKFEKLSKFLPEDNPVNVVIRTVKDDQIIEVCIPCEQKTMVRAEARTVDLYAAIDVVRDMLLRQLRKKKEKREKKKNPAHPEMHDLFFYDDLIRKKQVELRIETLEEAEEELEMLGHSFHLFLMEDGHPAVLYKRRDGGLGLIKGC